MIGKKTSLDSPRTDIHFWRPWYSLNLYPMVLKNFFVENSQDLLNKVETDIAGFLGCKFVVLMPSGRSSITTLITEILSDTKKDILLPSFVCKSVPDAIIKSRRTVKFLDINEKTFNIDIEEIEKNCDKETSGLIAVHQFGSCCNMKEICKISEEKDIFVIEDAAQAFGVECGRKKAGTIADVGILSFNNKVIDALGGGAVITNNETYYEKIKKYRDSHYKIYSEKFFQHFLEMIVKSEWPSIAIRLSTRYNSCKSDSDEHINLITLLIIKNSLQYVNFVIQKRRENFTFYNQFIQSEYIEKPIIFEGSSCTFYNIRLKGLFDGKRDIIQQYLKTFGIETIIVADGVHKIYQPNLHLPNTENISKNILSFPTSPHLNKKQLKYICEKLNGLNDMV